MNLTMDTALASRAKIKDKKGDKKIGFSDRRLFAATQPTWKSINTL